MSVDVIRERADETWSVALRPPWVVVRFREPQRIASWAIVRGGLCSARAVAWLGVRKRRWRRVRWPPRRARWRCSTRVCRAAPADCPPRARVPIASRSFCPHAANGSAQRYAGKHTAEGHVIAAAVYGAVQRGVAAWLAEQAGERAR